MKEMKWRIRKRIGLILVIGFLIFAFGWLAVHTGLQKEAPPSRSTLDVPTGFVIETGLD